MTTRVVHCKKEPYDIYIGRPSKWGNPFVMGRDGGRQECIDKFRAFISTDGGRHILDGLDSLRGKRLGCYCSPLPCHGDVLKELADG